MNPRYTNHHQYYKGPKGWEILTSAFRLYRNQVAESSRLHARFGDHAHLPGPKNFHFFFHPDQVQYILKDNAKNYHKSQAYRELYPLLGLGLVTSEGELWKKQRRLIGPEFRPSNLVSHFPSMRAATNFHLKGWEEKIDQGRGIAVFDLSTEMMSLTFKILGGALFDDQNVETLDIVEKNLKVATHLAVKRVYGIFPWPAWFPTPNRIRSDRSIRKMEKVFYNLVHQYQQLQQSGESPKNNLLHKLMQATHEGSGLRMSQKQLRDEIMTLVLAGHETTSHALSWTLYLLSQDHDALQKVREELHSGSDRPIELEDIKNLKYLKAVFLESMRLFPPVPIIGRGPIEDDIVLGIPIPKNSMVAMVPWVTHRHAQFWDRPEEFLPERFLEEKPGRHPFAYFPFAGGPRGCIGEEFAMMEGMLILASILRKFDMKLHPEARVVPFGSLTLKPKYGIKVMVRRGICV